MTVRKDKPNSAEETARVLRIYRMLREEIERDEDAWVRTATLLEVADSIARRTEDD